MVPLLKFWESLTHCSRCLLKNRSITLAEVEPDSTVDFDLTPWSTCARPGAEQTPRSSKRGQANRSSTPTRSGDQSELSVVPARKDRCTYLLMSTRREQLLSTGISRVATHLQAVFLQPHNHSRRVRLFAHLKAVL
ncbi:hypothetical protein PoB_002679300 [Plakobranchus ocellatus]|uniref:Uncharacterized protein n=1 Tax=Plakobranchus ocellatus TaxID=259542 RepID=A0AAV4A0N0_9GAST|nr:hypothetical protein PoB_002679300 [Plakobranchus ocellatus]